MPSLIDFAELDLRSAFDLAIMIEEDAQLRYEQLSRLLGKDPGGAGDVFRMMVVNEGKHRTQLASRRDTLFRGAAPRIQISLMPDGVERPDVDDDELPGTAREALEVALAAEKRSYQFYGEVIPYLKDLEVRAFFEELMQEEAEHGALLSAKIARLGASAADGADRARPRRDVPSPAEAAAEPYPDRALLQIVLPKFDAATQAVATGVILKGMAHEEVAAALGVSRRTVAFKLKQFLGIARQHVAVALAAAALTGCAGGAYDADTGRFIAEPGGARPGASSASSASLTEGAGPSASAPAAQGSSYAPPSPAYDRGPSPSTYRGSPSGGDPGSFDSFSRTPPAPTLQADGTPVKPELAQISPSSGSVDGGEEVLITGSGFANVQVIFGSTPARITSQSSNAITVVVPQGNPGPASVVVTNRDGTYAVGGGAYTYR